MKRKILLVAVALAVAGAVARRRSVDDEDLWHEATSEIDLR